ncbi:MAG: PIN domain-containing protein [Candidatus Dormibacteria bacterium]
MSAELQFLDTNILVYAHDTTAGDKRLRALELMSELVTTGNGAVSVQVLQEFFVTITAKVPNRLAAHVAASVVAGIGRLPLHTPDLADVLAAIEVHERLQLSFWDAMIVRSAERLGCALLWSEDLFPGERYEGVELRNPFS